MTDVFKEYLAKIQGLQRITASELCSFAIVTKYDDYFEEYLEVEIKTDNSKFFMSTYNCVDESEYAAKFYELQKTIDEILVDERNEQESNIY